MVVNHTHSPHLHGYQDDSDAVPRSHDHPVYTQALHALTQRAPIPAATPRMSRCLTQIVPGVALATGTTPAHPITGAAIAHPRQNGADGAHTPAVTIAHSHQNGADRVHTPAIITTTTTNTVTPRDAPGTILLTVIDLTSATTTFLSSTALGLHLHQIATLITTQMMCCPPPVVNQFPNPHQAY